MKGGEVQMLDQDWLCYKYCKIVVQMENMKNIAVAD